MFKLAYGINEIDWPDLEWYEAAIHDKQQPQKRNVKPDFMM